MTVTKIAGISTYIGVAADVKPTTGVPAGSRFYERDTGLWFLWDLTAWGQIDAAITDDLDTLLTRLSALRAGYLDELDFDLTARLGTPAGASLAADLLTIDNLVDDLEGRLTAARATDLDFAEKVLEVSVTAAANAGVTTVATVTTQPCQIESIIVHADAAQTGDMTSCAVKGGASQVVTFISAATATQANLDAADKQVSWTGAVRLAATKTIAIDLQGTGATAVDLTVTIKYRVCAAGGSLT